MGQYHCHRKDYSLNLLKKIKSSGCNQFILVTFK